MNTKSRYLVAFVITIAVMTPILTACGNSLPSDATKIVLGAFDPDEKAQISSAKNVEPLPQDLAAGAEEVWCVNLTFTCWSCDYGQYQTCAESRLVRRVGEEWQVSLLLTEEDKELWEARGCELMEDQVQWHARHSPSWLAWQGASC